MPDEQLRASKKFRASKNFRTFLDGEKVARGSLTISVCPRDGMLCTLGGKVVNILAVLYNETSGEIDEIYLEEVRE